MQDESNNLPGKAVILVYSNTAWSGIASGDDLSMSSKDGTGDARYVVSCNSDFGLAQGNFQKNTEGGWLVVAIIQNGQLRAGESTNAAFGIAHAAAECYSGSGGTSSSGTDNNGTDNSGGGGCLIATATYGSELAPQVQQLRELRDNQLLQTESGTIFMNSFNDFYYSFSPIIADYERENPVFKEMIKITITPLISSLSILNFVDMDSEIEVLGYGISLILLNIGMYFAAPVIVIMKIRKRNQQQL